MGKLTPSFKSTYSEVLQHIEEAITTEIKEQDRKLQALAEMIDDLESRIKDHNAVFYPNNQPTARVIIFRTSIKKKSHLQTCELMTSDIFLSVLQNNHDNQFYH